MTNPFATAIDCLRAFKNDCKTDRLDSAIRLLETAEKIPKKDAEQCLLEGAVAAWKEIEKLLALISKSSR